MEPRDDALKKDLEAAVRTRQELGSEYESELIDSFLSRLDARLDAQVERRVRDELDRQEEDAPPMRRGRMRRRRDSDTWFAMFSLIVAIPLSAIGASGPDAGTSRLAGLVVVWAGIIGVNAVRYFARHRAEAQRAERDHRPPRSEWA